MGRGMPPSLTLTAIVLIFVGAVAAQDLDHDGISDANESLLAKRFSPVLHLAPRDAFFPTPVRYAIENSQLKAYRDGKVITVASKPTVGSLSVNNSPGYTYFLDNVHGGVDDDGVALQFSQVKGNMTPTVYARVTPVGNFTVIQYWFYYPFNDGPLNRHEGDWEMIQVVLSGDRPVSAGYSQHFSGQWANWEDVLTRGDHPVVYVARGSHANYFRSYQGVLGLQNDVVSASGETLLPENYNLVVLGEIGNHSSDQGWLDFSGRWGEVGSVQDQLRARNGPYGPGHGDNEEKWFQPIQWQQGLHQLDPHWLWLSWLVANFAVIFIAYIVIRSLWTGLALGKGAWTRRALKGLGVGAAVAIAGAILALLAYWQPWYVVSLDVPSGAFRTDGEVPILLLDGVHGLVLSDPQSDRGLVTLFSLRFPVGLLLVSGLIFLILNTLKAGSPGELRKVYIRSSIGRLLNPVVAILVLVFLAGWIASSMFGAVPEVARGPVGEILHALSSSPVAGRFSGTLPKIGEAKLSWGLGLGSYLMVLGAALQFIGGILCRGAPAKEGKSPEPGGKPEGASPTDEIED